MIIENAEVKLQSPSSSTMQSKSVSQSSFKTQLKTIHQNTSMQSLDDQAKEEIYAFRILMAKFVVESLIDNLLGKKSNCSEEQSSFGLPIKPDSLIDQHNRQKFASTTIQTKFSIQTTKEYTKKDMLTLQSTATIKTDQQEIDINLLVNYSKEFQEISKEKIELEKTIYIDPLVIQYDLSKEHFDMLNTTMEFTFDIDNDGHEEVLNYLKEGNGYLALDKDQNGKIDNGNELFGPSTNDGFTELSIYDQDNNNWIDANDPIFDKLQVWLKDESGNDSLVALGEGGVGAIYLQDIKSNFHYHKDIDSSIAKLNSSSIFVSTDHKIGLINAIDYAKN